MWKILCTNSYCFIFLWSPLNIRALLFLKFQIQWPMSEILVRAYDEHSHSECGLGVVLQGFFWLFVVIGCYILTFLIIVSTNSLKRPRAIILSNPLILVTFIMQYILHSSATEPQLYPETIKQISELQCYTLWHTGMSRNHIKHTAVYFNSICCHINSKCTFIHLSI